MAKKKEVTKQDIKDFAKELYFDVDTEGKRVHSHRDICAKIAQNLRKTVAPNTIKNWAKAENWEATFIKLKIHGIETAQKNVEQQENELIQEKSTLFSDLYKENVKIFKYVSESIENDFKTDPTIRITDKIKLLEVSQNMLLKISPVEDNKIDQLFEQLINSLDSETIEKLLNKI